MIHIEARLAVLRSDSMYLRMQLAEIADLPGYENDRTLLFRELVRRTVVYKALLRKHRRQSTITLRQRTADQIEQYQNC